MSTHNGQGPAARHQGVAESSLPVEGRLPAFDGAKGWLNSQPLTPSALHGKVVVVQFWTYTCINWLRTQAYFRAWSQRYRDEGLVSIGVHSPEFKFEHDLDNVRWAVDAREIDYPVAIDKVARLCQISVGDYEMSSKPARKSKGRRTQSCHVILKQADITSLAKFVSTLQMSWPKLQCDQLKLTKVKGLKDAWKVDLDLLYIYEQ